MKKRNGKLMPIGGGEDKRDTMRVLRGFLDQIKDRRDPRVELITIATNMPREVSNDYKDAFYDLKFDNYDFIHIEDSRDADEPEFINRIKKADGIFFSGGNQLKLCEVLGGTKFLELLRERHKKDGLVIAGTSAGAAAMSVFMIAGGSAEEGLLKGEIKLTSGLGFIDNAIIDTHFTERGRFSRLMNIVGTNPRLLGLGFGEDTAAVIYRNTIEVIGSGLVVIIDGAKIKYSNVTYVKEGDPVTIEGLVVHLLAEGEIFDLKKKQVIRKHLLQKKKSRTRKSTSRKTDRRGPAKTKRTIKKIKHGSGK